MCLSDISGMHRVGVCAATVTMDSHVFPMCFPCVSWVPMRIPLGIILSISLRIHVSLCFILLLGFFCLVFFISVY